MVVICTCPDFSFAAFVFVAVFFGEQKMYILLSDDVDDVD